MKALVRSVALAVATGSLTLVLAGFAGEVAARYRERHRQEPPGTLPQLFYRHARLGHALVHSKDYYGWIQTDSAGFRGREVHEAKAENSFRLMIVGSSTAFDSFVSGDAHAWPERLEFWLRQSLPGRCVEVVNAGTPGYQMLTNVFRLQWELYRYRPDLILLYEGHNDLYAALRAHKAEPSDRPDQVEAVTPWREWLTVHSLLYGKVVERLTVLGFFQERRRVQSDSAVSAGGRARLDEGADSFVRDTRLFLSAAKALGLKVAVASIVHAGLARDTLALDPGLRQLWRNTVPYAQPNTVLAGYERYNAALERVAGEEKVPFVSTRDFGLTEPRWYANGDPIHFRDEGADRMAQQMARALVEARVIPAVPPGTRCETPK